MSGHVIEMQATYAVCRTCGQVGKPEDLVAHAVDTFLHSPAPERRAS